MSEQRDDDKVVGRLLVQRIGDPHVGPFALGVDDAAVTLQSVQSAGARPRHHRDLVVADACQMEGKGAANPADPEDGDAQSSGQGQR